MWQQLCSLWSLKNKRPGGVLSINPFRKDLLTTDREETEPRVHTHTYTHAHTYRNIATGKRKEFNQTLFPEDKGMHPRAHNYTHN